jgi:hypothetical protein
MRRLAKHEEELGLRPTMGPFWKWLDGKPERVVCGGDVWVADRLGHCSWCDRQIGFDFLLEEVPEKICVECWDNGRGSDDGA